MKVPTHQHSRTRVGGAGQTSLRLQPFGKFRPPPGIPSLVGVSTEQLQHTADGVGVIIVSVSAVIDRVSPASMDPALEQAQLAEKLGMVGQPDQASRE